MLPGKALVCQRQVPSPHGRREVRIWGKRPGCGPVYAPVTMDPDVARRVAILGCGGSGKSWLSARVGERLGLPVYGLDAFYFGAGWTPAPHKEFERLQRELVARSSWVIDGNHASTAEIRIAAADVVVFLDRSSASCLWGLVRRRIGRKGPPRAGVPGAERLNPRFVFHVATFRLRRRAQMLKLLRTKVAGHLIVLQNGRQMRAFLSSLPHGAKRS